MIKFQIGDRVQAGQGDDHDTGIIIEPNDDDSRIPHGANTVFVAWESGVRTWTPIGDLSAA